MQSRRKDFLIEGAQSETTHRVVNNLYNNNGLMMNVDKTQVLFLGRRSRRKWNMPCWFTKG